ncbi:MAG: ABC transporter substrate-binding protein, partial [Dehalococcoidia bacterium]|nr:ABC transporter substrate-binding protein [Dehalococcoidia bacterium]
RLGVIARVPTVAEVNIVDSRTVTIVTRAPDPILLRRVATIAIIPQAYVERVGAVEFGLKPIGSGPYRVREFIANDRFVLEAMPNHPARPTLTEISFRTVTEASARIAGLRSGEVDVIQQIPTDQAETLRSQGFHVVANDAGVANVLSFNMFATDSPIADRRVRQAINYAIDRDTLAQTVYRGLGRPAGVLVAEGVNGYSPQVRPYTLDRARARQLLTEAGYPNGFRMQFEFTVLAAETQPAALFVQDQLRQIGVELELAPVETAAFVDKIYKRRPIAPMFMTATTPGTLLDADSSLSFFVSDSIFGKRFVNARFDAAYNRMREELDPQRRLQLVREALEILQEEVPYAGVVTQPTISAHSRTVRIEGGLPPDLWPLFDRVTRVR